MPRSAREYFERRAEYEQKTPRVAKRGHNHRVNMKVLARLKQPATQTKTEDKWDEILMLRTGELQNKVLLGETRYKR